MPTRDGRFKVRTDYAQLHGQTMSSTILPFPARHTKRSRTEQTMTSLDAKTRTPARHGDPGPETPDTKTAKAAAAIVVAAGAILAIAHSLVKEGWSHRCMATNARNQACPADDPEATAWSIDGAIWLAAKKWRDEVNDQHGRATQDEQAPQKGGALHRHHSGPRCPMEIMALETVLQTVGLPITHNCRETVGMWNRSPERRAHDAQHALGKARASLKNKSALALGVLQTENL